MRYIPMIIIKNYLIELKDKNTTDLETALPSALLRDLNGTLD